MDKIRCDFCHEYVDAAKYEAHVRQHTKLQPDGQQTDYATLPQEDRAAGDLTGVPMWYTHKKCGQTTGMPEDIVRSYLVNPWLYTADATFCHGCGTHVPMRECTWEETGENLQAYMDRLRAAKPELKPKGCLATVVLWAVVLVSAGSAAYAIT